MTAPHPALCCPILASLAGDAGRRGLSVVAVGVEAGTGHFAMQSRGCDAAAVESLQSQQGTGVINILTQQALRFCPSCGTNLATWVSKHRESFDALALLHQQFAL